MWMKIGPYYQRWRCSPMSLVSGSTRFMRIFAEVPWRGGVRRQYGNRKRRFSGLSTLRLRDRSKWGQQSTLLYSFVKSLVAFPLTPTHMTLNELEWLFYVKFSLLRTAVSAIRYIGMVELTKALYLVSIEYFCMTSPAEMRASGPWFAEYYRSAKGLRIFRKQKVAGVISSEP